MGYTGKTKNLGVIGWPIAHSLSSAIQNAALQQAGLDYGYIAMPVRPEALAHAVQGLRSLGFQGFNVTIPHKTAILPLLDEVDEGARRIGAVNTVVVRADKLIGFNTDAEGFITALKKRGFDAAGKRAVLLGAGGAARAVVWGLITAGVRSLAIGARTPEKARSLQDAFAPFLPIEVFHWEETAFQERLATAELLVNATPLGMAPRVDQAPPVDWERIAGTTLVYDLIYVPETTRFLHSAVARGCRVLNGAAMLVEQGAAAFRLWTGREPSVETMTRALQASLPE